MNQKVLRAVVRRLRILPCPSSKTTSSIRVAVCGQLASMGYEASNLEGFTDLLLQNWSVIEHELLALKGAHVNHVPLFKNFPDEMPNDQEVLARHTMLWFGSFITEFSKGVSYKGTLIPEWMRDPMFGLSSIPQNYDHYVDGIAAQGARGGDSHTVLHPVEFVSDLDVKGRIQSFLKGVLYAGSSIKEAWRPDIELLLEYVGPGFLDSSQIQYKENLVFVTQLFWERKNYAAVESLVRSATDVLRLFASLTGGDVSLAEKIKYPKLSKPQRRAVLSALESTNNLVETLNDYRGLWLKIGRGIHVGEYSQRFPKTVEAFNKLREGQVNTWNSLVEQAYKSNATSDVLRLLTQRPGQFARGLHRALRAMGEPAIDSFMDIAHRVPLKTLLVMERYFATVDTKDTRAFFVKTGRLKIVDNTLKALPVELRDKTLIVLKSAIRAQISAEGQVWDEKKVWVDPTLAQYLAPLAQRKASDSLITVGRGTRIPFDSNKVIRVFVYWKQQASTTDLDLSAVTFDSNFEYKQHVSYTRLAGQGMAHSGDLTSAPHGSAEFIDMDIEALKNTGARYVAPQIYRYSGENFGDCEECFSGWMSRQNVNKDYRTFDVKTVENAFAMKGQARYSVPFLVDLHTNQVIYVDLYVGGPIGRHNRVENSHGEISSILREIVAMGESKPNLFDLAMHHVVGRGATGVGTPEEADIRIGVRDCDFNALDTEVILSEFL